MPEIKPDIAIIGAGALGTNLALALSEHGYAVKGIFNRTEGKAQEVARLVNADHYGLNPKKSGEIGQIIFLCVPDDHLKNIAHHLVSTIKNLRGKYFVHCSGAKSANEIEEFKSVGASVASFHPLQTFLKDPKPDAFKSVNISLQGDEQVIEELSKIALSLNAQSFKVSEKDKILLHIAAVFACNYMVSIDMAAKMILSGSENPKNITLDKLFPLMEQTLNNIENYGPENSLSGPIKRGDAETIRKHLQNMGENEDLISLYQSLGLFTLNQFIDTGMYKNENLQEIIRLFKNREIEKEI